MTKINITIVNEYTRNDERAISQALFDEMRDEIAHLHEWVFTREEILRIIDKYKAKSEA